MQLGLSLSSLLLSHSWTLNVSLSDFLKWSFMSFEWFTSCLGSRKLHQVDILGDYAIMLLSNNLYWDWKINLPRPPFPRHRNGIAECIRINYRPPLQGPWVRPGKGLDVLGLGDALQGDRGHGAPHHGRVVSSTSAVLRGSRGHQTGAAPPLQIRSRGEFRENGYFEAILSWDGCQKDYVWINLETLENQYQPLVAESANQIKYKVSRPD